MRITEAARDAASKAIYMRHHGTDWDNESEETRGTFQRDAEAALAAATPLMLPHHLCPTCEGTGLADPEEIDLETICSTCKGSGLSSAKEGDRA